MLMKSIVSMYFKLFFWLGLLFGIGMTVIMLPVFRLTFDMFNEIGAPFDPIIFIAKMMPVIFVSSWGIYGIFMSAFIGTLNLIQVRRKTGTIIPGALSTNQERQSTSPATVAETIQKSAEAISALPNTIITKCDAETGLLEAISKSKWYQFGLNVKYTIHAFENSVGNTSINIAVIPRSRFVMADGGNSYMRAEEVLMLIEKGIAHQ